MNEQLFPHPDNSSDSLGELIGKILGSQVQSPSEVPRDPSEDTSTRNAIGSTALGSTGGAGGGASPFGDIFSSLLSNPDLLMKLPSIISAARPIIEMLSQSHKATTDSAARATDALPTSTSASASESESKAARSSGREAECRNALLCAMKPYLSSDRQNAVDYIVKLSRLGDILRTL